MRNTSMMTCLLFTVACGGTASKYCAKYATCAEDECDYSQEACSALAKGEKATCEANVRSFQASIRSGDAEECDACVAAMDVWLTCMSEISTCSDFFDGGNDDCDGEYSEYEEACYGSTYSRCLGSSDNNTWDSHG